MSEPNLLDTAPRAEFADALEDQLRRVLSGESPAEQPSRVAVADRSAVTVRPRRRVASGLAAAAAVAAIAVTGVIISGRPDRNQGPTPAPTTTSVSVPVTNPDTSPITSPTTDAITTTSVLLPHQPRLGANDAGTYAIRPFLVPFQLTTTGEWIRSINAPNGLALGRGTTVSFVVSTGAFPGTSAAEVVANLCPAGTLEAAAPATTTLLGAPADQVDAVGIAPCSASFGTEARTIDSGSTIRVVVATIDDVIVVVIAGGPTAEWNELGPEIAAMTASMQRIDT